MMCNAITLPTRDVNTKSHIECMDQEEKCLMHILLMVK